MNHLTEFTRARRLAKALVVGSSLTLLPIAAAVAQTLPPGMATPGSSDIQEVVRQALATNPEVQAAWRGMSAAGHEVGEARGNYFPSIDVAAGVGREYREGDGRGSYNTDFAELTLSQMIYDGFATRSEVERLDRAKLVRYYELLGASENVALEAARAYLDVSRYRDLVRLAQENYGEHQRVFNQIEERVRTGAGRGVDLQQISGRLALAESNLMTEASNLHDVTARYQRIVGELPAENLAPTPELDDRLPTSVAEAVDMAFQGNPEFHAAIENIEAKRAEQSGTRSAFQPRLDLQARTATERNQEAFLEGRRDLHRVQLVASMNLYRGGSDQAAFRAASERIEEAVHQRELACTNVRQTTQIAYNDTQRLREQLRYLNEHRQSIDRVRGAYQQQFDIGERTLLDVLDSENEYFEASRAFVNAQYDIALADARTLAAMGQLMQTLGVMREDMPTLAELGSDGVEINPDVICPIEGPAGFTLQDLTGDVSAPAPTRAPDVTLSADALFAVNSAELSADARGELDALVEQIGTIGDLERIFIAGHADSTGTDAINDPLSQRRADSVASYLVSQGVEAGLIETRGYGSHRPVASNDTVDGRRQNRRVEVTLERNGEGLDLSFTPPAFETAEPGSQPVNAGSQASRGVSLSSELDTREIVRSEQRDLHLVRSEDASPAALDATYLQVMALRDVEQASLLKEELATATALPVSLVPGGNLHRVRLGPIAPEKVADLQRELENKGYTGSYVVKG